MERKKKPTYKQLYLNLLAELGWLITGTEQLKERVQEEVVALRICYKGLKMLYEEYGEKLKEMK